MRIKLSLEKWIEIGKKNGWITKKAISLHTINRLRLRVPSNQSLVTIEEYIKNLENKLNQYNINFGLKANSVAADIYNLGYVYIVKIPETNEYSCGDTITAIIRKNNERFETTTVTYRRSDAKLYNAILNEDTTNDPEKDRIKKIISDIISKYSLEQPLTRGRFDVDIVLTLDETLQFINNIYVPSPLYYAIINKNKFKRYKRYTRL